MTRDGLLAINTPKGWVQQSQGPGLAFFVPAGVEPGDPEVWIYISSNPVGPAEDPKDLEAFIQADIAGFKEHFKHGQVRAEEAQDLPIAKQKAPMYSFQSGESDNAFEQVVYLDDGQRVLILTLSAKSSRALEGAQQVFREFAQSYGGSIQMDSPKQE